MHAIGMVELRLILAAGLAWLLAVACLPSAALAAEDTLQTAKAKEAVEEAGTKSAEAVGEFVQRVNESRLRNRTRDEIVAWALMGVLVGSVAGMLTSLKSTKMGRLGRLLLGLAGAMVGGMIVRVGAVDYGWGEIVIPYEELLYSVAAAIVFILLGRWIRTLKNRRKKN
jgi:uncharacterized membrane protein YeaQ/YmgE (transglycosylase-associated protein family)